MNPLLAASLIFGAMAATAFIVEYDCKNKPIESKIPIEPDLLIVVSGGELDTTFIYRRNP